MPALAHRAGVDGRLAWTTPAREIRPAFLPAVPIALALAVGSFFFFDRPLAYVAVGIDLAVAALVVVFLLRARDRSYELSREGLRIATGTRARAYRWSEFEGWEPGFGGPGRTFRLHPRALHRAYVEVWSTAAVDDAVEAAISRVLPRRDRWLPGPAILAALAMAVLLVALVAYGELVE